MNAEIRSRLNETSYYSWIPWFQALVKNIVEGGENYLVERARRVDWTAESPALLSFGDQGIDPISFFYFLASKNGASSRNLNTIFRSVHDEFELPEEVLNCCLTESQVIPTPAFIAPLLFHDGKIFNRDLLWKLFRQAVKRGSEIDEGLFSEVLSIKGVGVPKLTQCLFLINPYEFFPIDKIISTTVFREKGDVENQIKAGGYSKYKDLALRIRQTFPGCEPYETNMFTYWLNSSDIVNPNSNFFQLNTDIYSDNRDHWDKFDSLSCIFIPASQEQSPIRGDVVLARFGENTGRGVGVVLEDKHYQSENDEQTAIHVNWINKSYTSIDSVNVNSIFSAIQKNSAVYSAFASVDSYKKSLGHIRHRLKYWLCS